MNAPRAFRWLLRLLPGDFRADYGREMERVFREEHRDLAGGGPAARARLWVRAVRDLLAVAPAEHASQLAQDVRYAVRSLRKTPGFAVVAVTTLALGIGANTAMFGIVHAVLLRPLPYADPDRLVAVWNRWTGAPNAALSDPEFLDYQERTRTLDLAAISSAGGMNLTGGTLDAERVVGAGVSVNVLDVLGVVPQLGRAFKKDEEQAGRQRVAILSHALWQRRFGGDPRIIGRTIAVDGQPNEVVGVLPETFRLPTDFESATRVDLLQPLTVDRSAARNKRGGHYLAAVGRLRKAMSREAAAADMKAVITALIREYPDQHDQGEFSVVVTPLRDDIFGPSRPVLLLLLTAVGGVLLVACANVANLLLARGESRRRELAVRTALGASRLRVVRQLLTESCLLALAGAAAGLLVAAWCERLVVAIDPATLPRVDEVRLDPVVLAFTAALAIATGIVFGLLPALQVSRVYSSEALKEGARGVTDRAGARARATLVIVQVASALVLLVAGGLLVKSFARVAGVAPGIEVDRILTLRVSAPASRYPTQADVSAFFVSVLDRVRTLPGVRTAGAATGLPLAVLSGDWSFDVEGRPLVGTRHTGACDWFAVMPGYFESLGVRLVSGRFPTDADADGATRTIFINETAARQFFPRGDTIGQRMRLSGKDQPWRTIAGIVADVRHRGLELPPRPEMFIPLAQFKHFSPVAQARALTLVVRADVDPMSLVAPVRARLREADPEVPASQVRDMRAVVSESMADRRLNVMLIGSFGALALVLAAVGLYGLIAFHVVSRTREIGVRLALGSSKRGVLSMVLRDGMTLVGWGIAIGLAVALVIAGALARLLFEVNARDATVFALVPIVLAAVAALACYIPARRAARIDPLQALRAE